MHALEFFATVKNGVIEIPREYLKHLTNRVRVILLVEEAKPAVNFIDELLAHPVRVNGFRPLTREEVHAR
ncbi:MAG: hypothetical protein COZ69_05730 [Deltaproteobacteria bacterium CG_4_8_14_3_um_filter_45_9]|nr:MAG: hypothetical protein COS40_05820 [Deltaproteobacteria bacterium CG03_land_8_20_14_0_80_45_14]PIX24598.1 MAG: hypothetical protein COZ69_05730 [Deltaproteobacteria bacterium CG_4_8_14_3_um_filter_45_9]